MTTSTEDGRLPAALRLHGMAYGLGVTAALVAAVRLGVADALGDEPRTVAGLAGEVGADPGALRALLLALACREVFDERPDGRFAHTEMSLLLRADRPGSKRDMVLLAGAPFAWRIWPRLDEAVTTGGSVFPSEFGTGLHEHLAERDPASGEIFHRAMAGSGELVAKAVAEALDLAGVHHVCDVGGGRGRLLRELLEREAGVRGTLVDLPAVVDEVDPALREGPLGGRCAVVAADVREELDVEADLYLVKHVLHMWDDATAVAALAAIASAAPSGARVVVVEQLLDAGRTPTVTTTMGLLMLVSQGGRERTSAELGALLTAAGLTFDGVVPTASQVHLVAARVP